MPKSEDSAPQEPQEEIFLESRVKKSSSKIYIDLDDVQVAGSTQKFSKDIQFKSDNVDLRQFSLSQNEPENIASESLIKQVNRRNLNRNSYLKDSLGSHGVKDSTKPNSTDPSEPARLRNEE